jgi:uncharacterized protein GlcG (DUF336 family)
LRDRWRPVTDASHSLLIKGRNAVSSRFSFNHPIPLSTSTFRLDLRTHITMRSITSLLTLASVAYAQINGTNGIGSTPSERYSVSADQAYLIVQAAVKNATAIGIPQNVAVVDPSGLLVAFLRMDNAYIGSIDISQKKARTAVVFNGVTSAGLYNASQPGGSLYAIEQTNGGLVVFGGG